MRENFWALPLAELTDSEWEALCDGCGRCCLKKLQDEDDDTVYYTSVACKLFDVSSCRCSDYPARLQKVEDCLDLRRHELQWEWLPETCAYRLRANDEALPEWHYLRSGDRNLVHFTGFSMRHKVVPEDTVDEDDLEDYIIGPL
jgi:uncharacterized cysteine cluster protein YcgN (CxxCxxCC family)